MEIYSKKVKEFRENYISLHPKVCHERKDVMSWLLKMSLLVTSKEMVVGLPHSAYRSRMQTTLCCFEGN